MANEAAAALIQIQMMQTLFSTFESNVKFGSSFCPTDSNIEDISSKESFNFIIVGGGTAGLVLANRLSSCRNVSVLVIEAGGCPPFESDYLAYLPFLYNSIYDYNMTSVNDQYAVQNLQGGVANTIAGRMLGGSSSLQVGLDVIGGKGDFVKWSKAANDSSWSYKELRPYFLKSQNVLDKQIIKESRNNYGSCGPTKLKTQPDPETDKLFEAFVELGYSKRKEVDLENPFGVFNPLFAVDNVYRQSGSISYLYRVKNRKNLHVITNCTATKIIFNNEKRATGVQISYKGRTYVINSIDEIILSAGAIKTPQLLMLSGIGVSEHLKSKNIPVVSDLPVGKNLMDHIMSPIVFSLKDVDAPLAHQINPSQFPIPMIVSNANLDNSSSYIVRHQGIHLLFSIRSQSLMPACLNLFKYSIPVCQKMYNANQQQQILLSYAIFLQPLSRGEILLNTSDINDQPIIKSKYLSKKHDVVNLTKCKKHLSKLIRTRYFKKTHAQIVNLELCEKYEKYSDQYWECSAVAMSTPVWHYCGTAALGSVVDSKLFVKGVTGLRVVDGSVIPSIPSGKLHLYVVAIAEKVADVIRKTYNYSCCSAH